VKYGLKEKMGEGEILKSLGQSTKFDFWDSKMCCNE
jgi:hypothetical protein